MPKPTGRSYKLISADSHVVEAPDIWDKWLDPKYRDRAPKLVKDEEGGDAWQYFKDQPAAPLGLVSCVAIPREGMKWTGFRYGKEVHPSVHDGQARLEVLDTDGVDAEFLYPPQRAITSFAQYGDKELNLAGIEAYNQWLFEGFCAADPARLFGVYQIPNLGIETSVKQLHQAAAMGARGAVISTWPAGNPALGREDDPFWEAAEELQMPISMHFGLVTTQLQHPSPPESAGALGAVSGVIKMGPAIIDLIFSGVFDRFPGVKVLGIEVGCAWIPHVAEMMNDRYWRNRTHVGLELKKLPSQYLKDNFGFSYIVDQHGIQLRHAIGVENMLWSTDFPHHGNDYPYSRETIEHHFVNVPDSEKQLILHGNCEKLYGLT
jgi:predicted TIM-barrel fold metal-dependent hydrolase